MEDLQEQINELSAELKDHRQKLLALQEELDRLEDRKSVRHQEPPAASDSNFKLENFIGLRIIHIVGIIVLVTGLSIGVKYAIDQQLISASVRIILAYLAGIILYALSRQLKKKYQLFSAILFSGAMASLYFTTYAAFVYYGFFPFYVTFLTMTSLTIYTAFESMRYNRQEIAVFGMIGAYGIPFLISANKESADLFFSYIIIINLGIVYLSFRKKWRTMGQLALMISWTLFILWGFFRYQAKDFVTGLILIPTFYFLFAVSAMAYRLVRSQRLNAKDIQQITTNNLALYISTLVIFGYGKFGAHAASITGFVCACLLILSLLSYLFLSSESVLHQAMILQTIILFSLFIRLNWSGLMVTLLWAALAVVLFVAGVYSQRSWPRLTAIMLMSVTLGKLVIFDSSKFTTIQKIIAYLVIGVLLLVLAFLYQKLRDRLFEK